LTRLLLSIDNGQPSRQCEDEMTGTVSNLLLLGLLFLAVVILVIAPVGALGVMFWNWRKELTEINRLRQVRSTQIR
jgi:hypothetical protein